LLNYIPDDKISEIKNSSDIVEVISESVILKKAGRNHVGLCPFHTEKTPSFTVNSQKQIYHCFGCGSGGNIFSFMMKLHGMTFPESVKMLADRVGVMIETRKLSPDQKRVLEERERLLDLNEKILDHYRKGLNHEPSGKPAREYLQKRKISGQMQSDFALGFVPDKWDTLVSFYRKLGVSKRVAEKSGLVLEKNGHYYDRFRNRIIFPIFDVTSRVIGFGGRVMDDSLPKYMNSPETQLYDKSRSLYGLNKAKTKARQSGEMFIVEGYFDCISLSQHGFENVVATLGTSLTSGHVRMLKGYAENMILVYDSDAAGVKAAMRSIDVFMKESVNAKILVLPEGSDPDSFIQDSGKDAFRDLVSKAQSMMPFLINQSVMQNGLSIEGKLKVLDDMKDPLASLKDPVARSLYVKEISEKIGIDEPAVLEKMNEFRTKKNELERRKNTIQSQNAMDSQVTIQNEDKIELQLISMMLQDPGILPLIKEQKIIGLFRTQSLLKIGELIMSIMCDQKGDVSDVMAAADESQVKLIAPLAIGDEISEMKLSGLLSQFMRDRQKEAGRDIINHIDTAQQNNNQNSWMELLSELDKKKRKETKILNNKL